jgi:hypothetical protein
VSNKLFISYSHLDEKYVEKFIKHISPLKQNGLISEWYDRKILGGENFQREINNNIEIADIICLFISANFLSSDACMKEKEKAYLLKKTQGTSVIPIILSICGWKDDKDFSKWLALPTDGNPIDTYNDINKGWIEVYNGLKSILEKRNKEKMSSITMSFQKYLDDAEMLRNAHSQKNTVNISDIFVFPNLSKINYDDEKEDTISSENTFLDQFFNLEKILIAGESQSGKTTLCKKIYLKLRSRNLFPIYIYDKTLRFDGHISKKIEMAFYEQYENISISDIEIDKFIIIIDGFHFASMQKKQRILKDIEKYLYHVVVVDDIFALNINDENLTKKYYRYRLDQFGPILRNELIKKWILLTDDKSSQAYQDNDFYKKVEHATELVNIGLGKIINSGVMPSYPLFILSILSNHEAFEKPLDQEITSQGYCYQALIYISLRKQGVKNDEIDTYINFLSVLAYHFFSKNISEISEEEFADFLCHYKDKYYLPIDVNTLLANLQAHRMVIKTSINNYRFFYPYLYYYFVAKYFSDHLIEKKDEISRIVEKLHKDENAYITIFISHHTKNYTLLNEIVYNAMVLFEKNKETTLSKTELTFFDTELDIVAKAALPKQTSPETERQKQLELQEKQEREINEKKDVIEEKEDDYSEDLRRSLRTVEVMGIITKNRIGSLEKHMLEEIITEAINVNLRILSSFFDIIKEKETQQEMIRYISNQLQDLKDEKNHNISNEKLEREAKKIFWNLNFGAILGIIMKTIKSIGSDKLQKIIENVCDKQNTSVHLLIKHGVFMWYGKTIKVDKIIKEMKRKDFSLTANEILKYLIVYHCMFHNINSEDKNKLQSKFNISSKGLLKIEARKEPKSDSPPLHRRNKTNHHFRKK